MRRSPFPSACLAVGALACLAASALAAPAPPAADFDKYLPDDAQMVAVLNVKQVASWAPFQKQFQDQIQQLLKTDPIRDVLKDTGFDPLRDVDRVVIVAAASSVKVVRPPDLVAPKFTPPPVPPPGVRPPPPAEFSGSTAVGPAGFTTFFLVQGKFDADKLEAKARQLAKDDAAMIKSRKVGEAELWEITLPGPAGEPHLYLSLLDRNTLMATVVESQALEALDKAAGKRTTDLKDKQVRDALAKADSRAALRVVASGDLVTSVEMKSDGKGGVTTTTKALRDQGIEGEGVAVTLGDADLHAEATITAKDADKAKDMAKSMNDGLDMGIKNVAKAAQDMKDLAPLVDALKTVKIAVSGATISVEGGATPDAIPAGIKAIFWIGRRVSAPTGVDSSEVRPVPPPPMKDK